MTKINHSFIPTTSLCVVLPGITLIDALLIRIDLAVIFSSFHFRKIHFCDIYIRFSLNILLFSILKNISSLLSVSTRFLDAETPKYNHLNYRRSNIGMAYFAENTHKRGIWDMFITIWATCFYFYSKHWINIFNFHVGIVFSMLQYFFIMK